MIKFALISDSSSVDSYYSFKGEVYRWDDDAPYYRGAHIGNECLFGFWNYPVVMDGHFINVNEMELPNIQVDIVFAAIERDDKWVDKIRNKYPDAVICATIKELRPSNKIRRSVAQKSDICVMPYFHIDPVKVFGIHKDTVIVPQPINIDYMVDRFMVEKQDKIFNYENFWVNARNGYNKHFISMLNNPDDIVNGRTEPTSDTYQFDFIQMWKDCKYMINFDPTPNYGLQALQCAALGVIMIGGYNDTHRQLFPKLVGMGYKNIIDQFNIIRKEPELQRKIKTYAEFNLRRLYSFDRVRTQIKDLYYNIKFQCSANAF